METRRSIVLAALAVLTAIGIVGVHFWAQAHDESPTLLETRRPQSDFVSPVLESGGPHSEDLGWATGPAFGLVPRPQPEEPIVPQPAIPAGPRRLPVPEGAEPITGDSGQDSAILKTITDELPGASPEDRRAWLEQLRGLPPQAARELLQLRRGLGSPFASWEKVPSAPLAPDERPWPMQLAGPLAAPSASVESALAALNHARAVALNNLANAETDGFKRAQVAYRDLPYDYLAFGAENGPAPEQIAIGHGVRLAGTELDLTQGALRPSPNPLHVAIDGGGFIQVADGEHVFYTRLGGLSIGPDGTLCISFGAARLTLNPPLQIPSDAASILIAENGTVSVCSGNGDERRTVGRLQLARFANPAALAPQGDCLFATTAATGPPLVGFPAEGSCGGVKQFALEGSNVDVKAEIAALERIRERMEQLSRFAGHDLDRLAHRRQFARESVRPVAADELPGTAPAFERWLDCIGDVLRRRFSSSRNSRGPCTHPETDAT